MNIYITKFRRDIGPCSSESNDINHNIITQSHAHLQMSDKLINIKQSPFKEMQKYEENYLCRKIGTERD